MARTSSSMRSDRDASGMAVATRRPSMSKQKLGRCCDAHRLASSPGFSTAAREAWSEPGSRMCVLTCG